MSKLRVFDRKGDAVGEADVPDALLEGARGGQAVHDVVVAFRAGIRAGTASTKRKGEVAGSGRKPWKQKGTGRARAGYRQSPVWRGGGVAFGPHPRSYEKKVPRKVAQLAFRRAFSDRVAEGAVRVVESLELAAPKTRELAALLKAFGLSKGVLIVVGASDRNLVLASRNVPGIAVEAAATVSTYQMVRYPAMLITREGLETVMARLAAGSGRAE